MPVSPDFPTPTDPRQVLAAEQAHLVTSRAALRRMREQAEALFDTGEGVAGDSIGAHALGGALARRVAELADHPDTPLFFGRLTFRPDAGEHAGHIQYIGRRHVTDTSGEPLVLDWRAPLSQAFYRTSPTEPWGVAVRRRFGYAGGELTSYEDEDLRGGPVEPSRILTEEIERPRVGPMRDIVATIQPEQDALVRADLEVTLCVQGAPGTGKTAVGLHRVAYLLYRHRERLRRSGMLVVGPNRAFLRYIATVLPTLGELDVDQCTIDELVARAPVRGDDPPEVTTLKHDSRMATVLQRALWQRVRPPQSPLVVPEDSYRWRLDTETLADLVTQTRAADLPYLTGRERLRDRVVALLQRQVEQRRAASPSDSWLRRMGRSRPVTSLLNACWPQVTPETLVYEILSDPDILAQAADGVLDATEQRLLRWPKPPRSPRSARWSPADLLLLDEAAGLLERPSGFGHIVVDEAQDLSPMQARAVARRSPHGSVTVLGDLAQGTAAWAATDWQTLLTHLGKPDGQVVSLTTGFRVPAQVMRLANRLLPKLAVTVPEPMSLRPGGEVTIRPVTDLPKELVVDVETAVAREGSVGVIVPDSATDDLLATLAAAGIDVAAVVEDRDAPVTVVPASLAKGLEYDHVVLVEPAEILAAETRGAHRLYVALTRAVSRLTVLHTLPLPEVLVDDV